MKLIIGSHVSYKNDTQLLGSVKEALALGENTFMFYTGAPQNTKRGEINDLITYEAYKLMKENNIDLENIVVHAPYIINLCNENNFDFSVSFLQQEAERCDKLGITKMVLHPGSAVGLAKDEAIHNIARGLNIILNNKPNVIICLETMAGKGTEIGSSFEEIKEIINQIDNKDKIAVCLDTCHINDAGYDLNNFDEVLDQFDKIIGLNYLKCIHINDSKNEISSHKDRHENIGYGKVGFENILKVIYNERLENIPMILETPYISKNDESKTKEYPPYKFEIEMIKNKKFNPNLIEDIRSFYK